MKCMPFDIGADLVKSKPISGGGSAVKVMPVNWCVDEKGLTLLELAVVIVIIGIVGATALSGSIDDRSDLIAWHEKMKAHLRYAQTRSMNSSSVWGIKYVPAVAGSPRQYYLFQAETNASQTIDPTMAVRLPGEESATDIIALPDKMAFSLVSETVITFDHWGRPFRDFLLLPVDFSFTLSQGADQETILITAETGYIP